LPENYQRLIEEDSDHYDVPLDFPYRKVVGSLMYAMLGTRPDLATAVSVISRFLDKPQPVHIHLAIRILQYLANSVNNCLIYKPFGPLKLIGYADASYSNEIDYKSRSGYAFFFGKSLISWYSGVQSIVAQSAAEAEYYAAVSAANEAIWLKQLLLELRCPQEMITIYEDNQACIALTKNPENHKRTKHIQIKYHVVRQYVREKQVAFVYCPTKLQVADIFTKGVPGHLLRTHSKQLGLLSPGES
jgi:hypothetical protein